ncbi:antibiotic biosynthesis monooxygenase [Streptomyces sp. ET3-23]|uniref:antibiotic biosynthesis monooxygenase n=1 Tax=Streptomyces sp. ET3-23 TaxID=2885643 RepID=UPI001D11A333|nr:antibiotic biosynthesis monooxygenase [Streptomyces sp. ET3-23]MCC2280445.1 antibiotic biosynthesis monooxygenase [Streptomyces sp. ET3-23]
MSQVTTSVLPDIGRSDVTSIFVGQQYVPDRAAARALPERTVAEWIRTPWPAGILSVSCYVSTEEDTVLTYVQCSNGDAYMPFVASLHGPARAGAAEYRLRARAVPQGVAGVPACTVIAMFDVDGAERQERVIKSLVDALNGPPGSGPPGMLSANFHVSTDATRVLNYAEWTSDEAHLAFLDSMARVTTMRVSGNIPGVRPIGFKRYHLYHSISRPAD